MLTITEKTVTKYRNHILILLILISFILSIYCWDCFNLYSGREVIGDTSNLQNSFYHMHNYRNGPLLLLRPLFHLFGSSLFLVRLVGSLINAGVILLIYLIAKKIFNTETAIIASFLTVLNPVTNHLIHTDFLHAAFFGLLTVYVFILFFEDPNFSKAFLFGLLNGLALFQKLLHAYILSSLILVVLLFYRKKAFSERFLNYVPIILLSFFIGFSPYILNAFDPVNFPEGSSVDTFSDTIFLSLSHMENNIELRSDQIITALAPGREVVNYVEEYNPYDGKEIQRINMKANFSIHGLANIISLLLIIFSFIILLKFGLKTEHSLVLFVTFFFLFSFFSTNPDSIPIFHLTPVLPFFYLIFSRSYTITKDINSYCGIIKIIAIFLIVSLSLVNIHSQFYYYNSVSDEVWINENWPTHSPVHTEARKIMMSEYDDYGYKLTIPPFQTSSNPESWTRGYCVSNRQLNIKTPYECHSFRQLDCNTILVLPYPEHRDNSSNHIWNAWAVLDDPNETIFKPYKSLLEDLGEDNVREKQFITDHENKIVYSVLELRC